MKKFGLSTLVFLMLIIVVNGQDCDCKRYPYEPDPPCWDRCAPKIVLGRATKRELLSIVRLNERIAERISTWKGRSRANSLRAYLKVLSPKELDIVRRKLRSLKKSDYEYFQKPISERNRIRRIANPLPSLPPLSLETRP